MFTVASSEPPAFEWQPDLEGVKTYLWEMIQEDSTSFEWQPDLEGVKTLFCGRPTILLPFEWQPDLEGVKTFFPAFTPTSTFGLNGSLI